MARRQIEIRMGCVPVQGVAGNPDRHDVLVPARAALLEALAADPLYRTGAAVRKGNAIADAEILDRLLTAIREDRRSPREAIWAAPAAATATSA
ncbi:hypothetical protein RLEG3_26450 [Rhizobium leguminosarum bv. trifolii WSM1689]|nr:hypothetical protein RLEG3_26450 [Rhizobium leguminosarum bv. trifolii WSM1689]